MTGKSIGNPSALALTGKRDQRERCREYYLKNRESIRRKYQEKRMKWRTIEHDPEEKKIELIERYVDEKGVIHESWKL